MLLLATACSSPSSSTSTSAASSTPSTSTAHELERTACTPRLGAGVARTGRHARAAARARGQNPRPGALHRGEDRAGDGDPRRPGRPEARPGPLPGGVARGRAGIARARVLTRRAVPVRQLHRRAGRHTHRRVRDARRPGGAGVETSAAVRRSAVRQPQRRRPRVRPRRIPLHRTRRRRQRWRSAGERTIARHVARQDAAHRPASLWWRAVHDPAGQPVRRSPRRASRDLGLWAPEPMAVLVRPRHRRPVDRRRRAERVGGDRSPPRRCARGRELRLEPRRGVAPVRGAGARRRDPTGVRVLARGRWMRRDRRRRLPGERHPGSHRRLPVRRLLSRRARGVASAPGDDVEHAVLGPTVPDISSFGEDAAGELYVLSLDGGVYRLTRG